MSSANTPLYSWRNRRLPPQEEFENLVDSSDIYPENLSLCVIPKLGESEALPEIRPGEDSVPVPDLSTQEAVSIALDHWMDKNKNHAFYDLDYLSYLCPEELEGDGIGGYSYVQGFGIRKCVASWEVILGLKQVLFEGVYVSSYLFIWVR